MRSAITIISMLAGLAPAAAQEAGDPRLGLDVARESCASCHAILRVEDRSPNPNAPTFAHIANVPGMTATALHVALQSPHKTMPNVMFEPDELRNLIAYILTLKGTVRYFVCRAG
jgi:mono/diheme cytochrome c family protein